MTTQYETVNFRFDILKGGIVCLTRLCDGARKHFPSGDAAVDAVESLGSCLTFPKGEAEHVFDRWAARHLPCSTLV